MTQYIVLENTPGYLPEDDDPYITDDYDSAVQYLNDRAAEYENDELGDFTVQHGWASADNLAAVYVTDHSKLNDLGRYIAVEIYHDEG